MTSHTTDTYTTGDGRSVRLEDITELYRDGVNRSLPCSGKITHLGRENFGLNCIFDATDCDNLQKIKTSKNYSLVTSDTADRHIQSVRCVSQPQSVSELAVATSDNGRFLARLRGGKESNSNKQFLELWDRSRLMRTINIDELEEHGSIIVDEQFKSIAWCPFGEQDKLLYVCQSKERKNQSVFKQQVRGDTKLDPCENYLQKNDWGEGLTNIEHTMVGIIDTTNFKITLINQPDFSLADSRWVSECEIVSTAHSEVPRRLGILYCKNRPSKLIVHKFDGEVSQSFEVMVTDKTLANPRVSHSGKKILYTMNEALGAHCHSTALCLFDIGTKESQILADDLFLSTLPTNCFSMDDLSVLFVYEDFLRDQMCIINTQSKQLHKIKFPTAGLGILDFDYDIILATGSEINTTPTLYVATLNSPDLVAWHQIEDCIHIDEVSYQSYKLEADDKKGFIGVLLVTPNLRTLYRNFKSQDTGKSELELPTIVLIHGGPHSRISIRYVPYLVLHARLGLKTLIVNYRGSTGIDESHVNSLLGKIGIQDVNDCLQAIRHFVKLKLIDSNKLIVSGGSHGGFLSCHLSGQNEFKFTSAIIRNPVVDLVASYSTSDIPDWVCAESGSKFDLNQYISKEDLLKLYDLSPMTKIDEAKVPTLMMLGSEDRRVKMFQGERWVELLKMRGVETKCKIYEDRHSLAKPEVHADASITAMVWMLQHLQGI